MVSGLPGTSTFATSCWAGSKTAAWWSTSSPGFGVTAREEVDRKSLPPQRAQPIVDRMNTILDHLPALLYGPPAILWVWGLALEQLGAGVERIRAAKTTARPAGKAQA